MKPQIDTVLDAYIGTNVLKARMMYDRSDPLVVLMQVYCVHGPVTWLISRDLLRDGMTHPVGDGDVHVSTDEATGLVSLELSSPSGHAVVAFEAKAITDLLDASARVVMWGDEFRNVDWDAVLRAVSS